MYIDFDFNFKLKSYGIFYHFYNFCLKQVKVQFTH